MQSQFAGSDHREQSRQSFGAHSCQHRERDLTNMLRDLLATEKVGVRIAVRE